ncbi:TPA: transporter substrate-binding protein [Klebsiella pneumoniae]|uniref:transporter substrate-binding domain-containing protein n=1 Tax=Burkholderiaceae TaxID=119060 RepID=UPI001DA81AD4|nr:MULTISPECIES: transporter substrate-binding domain-containing protein [Cupriavidus]MBR7281938.1 transporter substrate-binding domain-containing protein [Klebsiella pneumoniae]HBW8058392.1 transporter substrate-binding domain-containing protein [Klebsiella pneumoniae]HBZ3553077.1 transporter substrate-binding protein [Klebsiella pneumoniae]
MANSDPIQVGVLFSREGIMSRVETSMLFGTMFSIEEINDAGGLGGRELVPVHYDPQSNPARYAQLAAKLIQEDKVNVIFGCANSNARKAVLPVIERSNRMLFYPMMYEGFEFSPNVIYTGGTPNQHNAPLAHYMSNRFGPRVYMVGSDYIFPYESNRTMSDFILQQKGGKKLGERYVPLDAQEKDFSAIVQDIKQKQPDFVFSTVVGQSTRMFYQAYADAGLDPRQMPIASLSTSECEVAEMGNRIAEGHYTAAPYFRSISTSRNRSCVARFVKRFGDRIEPNMSWEAAYFQVQIFAKAISQVGEDAYHALLPNVLGCEIEAPQGDIRVDPVTHHTRLHPRIGRVNASGQFTIVAQALSAIDADPYMISHDLNDWTHALQIVGQDGNDTI